MSEPVEIRVREGDCPCPGRPHAFEVIYVEPRLTNQIAAAALYAINEAPADEADVRGVLAKAYLHNAIRRWTFLRAVTDVRDVVVDSEPVPITPETIEECVPFWAGGMELINALDGLYSGDLLRPLARARSKLSPPTSTDDSTSATPESGSPTPRPSRRSSPNGRAGRVSAVRDL